MKKAIVAIAFNFILLAAFAQQDYQFSMNMFNRLAINPAYAGMNKSLCATMFYRNQWVGFKDNNGNDGAPKTGLLSIDYGRIFGGGVGLTTTQDQIGFFKTFQAKVAYSYHLKLNVGVLGIGLDAGVYQQSFTAGSNLIYNQPGDTKIPSSSASGTAFNLGFGLYYQTRKLYLGLSSLELPQSTINQSNFKYSTARHYYLMAGYTFILNPEWEITPSILSKSVLATTQVDLNLMAKWRKTLFAGASYRLGDAVIVMAGIEKPINRQLNAKFGYAYDISTSAIRNYSSGSHEFMLGFCYKIVPDVRTSSHMNVRFL